VGFCTRNRSSGNTKQKGNEASTDSGRMLGTEMEAQSATIVTIIITTTITATTITTTTIVTITSIAITTSTNTTIIKTITNIVIKQLI
jgi:hypothetical protein